MAKGILIAAMDFSAAPEDEFHDWYDLEHIPERLAIPGFLNAQRWIAADNPKVSLATYDLDDVGVLHSAPYQAIGGANSSPWTKRTARFSKGSDALRGEQLFPGDKIAPEGAAGVLLIAMNVVPEHEAEFNEWYNTEHAPAARFGARDLMRPALPRHRCDAALCRALSLRPARRDAIGRMENRGQHAVDREDAAAFPRPRALRVPAIRPQVKRLTTAWASASAGGSGLKFSGLSLSICSRSGTCAASQPPPSAWISATLATSRLWRMVSAASALLSAAVWATMTAGIGDRPGLVLVDDDSLGLARGVDRDILGRGLLGQDPQRGELVLDLLERRSAPSAGNRRPSRRIAARACSTWAWRAPASNTVSARVAPNDQIRLDAENNLPSVAATLPASADSVTVGKNAASATPICALAAAIWRSAAAMSGPPFEQGRRQPRRDVGQSGHAGHRQRWSARPAACRSRRRSRVRAARAECRWRSPAPACSRAGSGPAQRRKPRRSRHCIGSG